MNDNHNCITCSKPLKGKQTLFCSGVCKTAYHQDYEKQCERGRLKRLAFIEELGGCCSRCGYKKNSSALQFHHVDTSTKLFNIDIRRCSNNSDKTLRAELAKCILLCANCHTEEHNPQHMME